MGNIYIYSPFKLSEEDGGGGVIHLQCFKLRVHLTPGVHIFSAGCIAIETFASGVCMVFPTFMFYSEFCTWQIHKTKPLFRTLI